MGRPPRPLAQFEDVVVGPRVRAKRRSRAKPEGITPKPRPPRRPQVPRHIGLMLTPEEVVALARPLPVGHPLRQRLADAYGAWEKKRVEAMEEHQRQVAVEESFRRVAG